MDSENALSPNFTHRKANSAFGLQFPSPYHRRIQSSAAGSPEVFRKPFTESLPSPIGKPKNSSRSFIRLLDASVTYFSQSKSLKIIENNQDFNPVIKNLDAEKEDIKIQHSKLQLALAQARAKATLYKNKIKSLKKYCKILEVNSFSSNYKTFLKEQTGSYANNKARGHVRRQTAEPVSNMSSETEFENSEKLLL